MALSGDAGHLNGEGAGPLRAPRALEALLVTGAGCALLCGGVVVALAVGAMLGLPEGLSLLAAMVGQSAGLTLAAVLPAAISRPGARVVLGLLPARRWWLVPGVLLPGLLGTRIVETLRQWVPSLELGALEDMAELIAQPGWSGLAAALILVILVPLTEEMLFRGYVFSGLVRSWGTGWAVVVSSLLFALFHLDPVQILGVLPGGLWFGWLRARTGSLWPCIAAHALNNALAVLEVRLGFALQGPHWSFDLGAGMAAIALVVTIESRARRSAGLKAGANSR